MIVSLILVFLTSCLLSWLFIKRAVSLGWVAHPDQHRQHKQATPLLGGLAIVLGIIFGVFIFGASHINVLPSLLLLCVVGIIDDRFKLPSTVRFIAQAVAAYLMIELTGVQLTQLGQLVSEQTVTLTTWSTPLTVFAVIGVINALNMSDGHDGLAGSLVILILVSLLIGIGSHQQADLITITIASTLGFLVWNVRVLKPQANIFMGDAGSTALGFLLAYLFIDVSQNTANAFLPVTALWVFALPLFDAVAVLLVRPIRGKSPFSADRIHYHHQLRDRGISVNQVLISILTIQTLFIAIGLCFAWQGVTQSFQFFLFLFLFFIYFGYLLNKTK